MQLENSPKIFVLKNIFFELENIFIELEKYFLNLKNLNLAEFLNLKPIF